MFRDIPRRSCGAPALGLGDLEWRRFADVLALAGPLPGAHVGSRPAPTSPRAPPAQLFGASILLLGWRAAWRSCSPGDERRGHPRRSARRCADVPATSAAQHQAAGPHRGPGLARSRGWARSYTSFGGAARGRRRPRRRDAAFRLVALNSDVLAPADGAKSPPGPVEVRGCVARRTAFASTSRSTVELVRPSCSTTSARGPGGARRTTVDPPRRIFRSSSAPGDSSGPRRAAFPRTRPASEPEGLRQRARRPVRQVHAGHGLPRNAPGCRLRSRRGQRVNVRSSSTSSRSGSLAPIDCLAATPPLLTGPLYSRSGAVEPLNGAARGARPSALAAEALSW